MSSEVECFRVFHIECLYRQLHQEIRYFQLTLLAARTVLKFDNDREHMVRTKVTDTRCILKGN